MPDRLPDRIADQFSYRGERADIWRGFDLLLDTDAYLNLGYSRWYQTHLLGAPQRRLAAKIGADLAARRPGLSDGRLLDLGCGRGGPALVLAERIGCDVAGVDLVPYNVRRATANAARRGAPASFVLGDSRTLPFEAGAFDACVAIDSIVYVPEKRAVFEEAARVTRADGLVVASDLVVTDEPTGDDAGVVEAFADAWDMPSIPTLEQYRAHVGRAGLTVDGVTDLSPNSIDRFRRWSGLYCWLDDHAGRPLAWACRKRGLDAESIATQVRRAHEALPHLGHVLLFATH